MTSRLRWRLAVGCWCLLVCLGALSMPALAGDGTVVVSVEPTEIEADAGEEIDLEVQMAGDGDLYANGYDQLSATVSYDPDVFTVVDAEHGPFLLAGDDDVEVDGDIAVDESAGQVTVEQERVPAGDGARGADAVMRLTLSVAADAEATTESIEITDESIHLVSDFQSGTADFDGTVHVEGGDSDDEETASEEPDGVTFSDEQSADEDSGSAGGLADDTADQPETGSDDSIPGFTISAAIGILALAIGGRLASSN